MKENKEQLEIEPNCEVQTDLKKRKISFYYLKNLMKDNKNNKTVNASAIKMKQKMNCL